MRINHLFISSTDVEKSTRFYCDLLGFIPTRKFNDGGGDSQIVHREDQKGDFDLLIVPTGTSKLSYANHIAFEVETKSEFDRIFETAQKMNLNPRSEVSLDSSPGISSFQMYQKTYRHFYVLDPSWVNIEIMWHEK